jgi:hypothetical protein
MRGGVLDPKQIVHADPEILGGTPVFVRTRVPVDALIDFRESGDRVYAFLARRGRTASFEPAARGATFAAAMPAPSR